MRMREAPEPTNIVGSATPKINVQGVERYVPGHISEPRESPTYHKIAALWCSLTLSRTRREAD